MRTRKYAIVLALFAALCFSLSVPTYGQNAALSECGKLSELKGKRRVFVAATESLRLKNIARLIEKEEMFQLVKNQPQAEFFIEGLRSEVPDSRFGHEVISIYTTLQVSYARADAVKVIVWSETVTSNIQVSSPGASLRLNSTQDEVILIKRFVKAFKEVVSINSNTTKPCS